MGGLSFSIQIVFELIGDGDGRFCSKCAKPITGQMYGGVLQIGPVQKLDMSAVKMFICEDCKKSYGQASK